MGQVKNVFFTARISGTVDILLSRYESRPTGYLLVLDRAGRSGKMPDLRILKNQHALA